MTRILPPVTTPWSEAISRRHVPDAKNYEDFRPCLRWEFGFSCAFCLLHESDIANVGVEGWGLTQIEHFVPQSREPYRADDYTNCFYICRRCNLERGIKGLQGPDGALLLNPCDHIWGQHFEITVEDEIHPRERQNSDARYTRDSYQLNSDPKVKIRAIRRRLVSLCRRLLERWSRINGALLDMAVDQGNLEAVDRAAEIEDVRCLALLSLFRYQAIPVDHDPSCGCGNPDLCSLPRVLEDQTFAVP